MSPTQDEIILLLGREVNRLSDLEMESKYKDALILNLRAEVADLSQRLSEAAAAAAASVRQSSRCDPKFQGLDEGDDLRQKEIESMKSQVGLWDELGQAHQSVETSQSVEREHRWGEPEEGNWGITEALFPGAACVWPWRMFFISVTVL